MRRTLDVVSGKFYLDVLAHSYGCDTGRQCKTRIQECTACTGFSIYRANALLFHLYRDTVKVVDLNASRPVRPSFHRSVLSVLTTNPRSLDAHVDVPLHIHHWHARQFNTSSSSNSGVTTAIVVVCVVFGIVLFVSLAACMKRAHVCCLVSLAPASVLNSDGMKSYRMHLL